VVTSDGLLYFVGDGYYADPPFAVQNINISNVKDVAILVEPLAK
jgi:hypothetical protein